MDEQDQGTPVYSRRNVLGKLFLGATALVSSGLLLKNLLPSSREHGETDDSFPSEDSIFHPKQDPREDPRRSV